MTPIFISQDDGSIYTLDEFGELLFTPQLKGDQLLTDDEFYPVEWEHISEESVEPLRLIQTLLQSNK